MAGPTEHPVEDVVAGGVEGWFARSTHHWDDWTLADLVAAKGSQRVSLVVPARNEAGTVGDVVSRVRAALVETVALVDEVVVIDSDSTDATYAVASDAGAVVHRSAEVRPDLGSHPGKGEAMWKSLFVTTGDVLVFMDADLLDWDTHFVPGLLGPLLTRPEVALVKGFYERPGAEGPYDGGRVTELVARPLIALEHPELAGLVQPLAGEWAVRRSLFEALPVPTGYAVELAALVDTAGLLGLDAIAQVDLGRRDHAHQALLDLGAMATQILAAMASRRDGAGASGAPGGSVALRQYRPGPAGIAPADRVVLVAERPPARSVA
ncbi:glucosyl-3-phosphoglycerate synthase [Nocardioides sp. zg-579]|uniref:Glucosyl-3-phosphoglycerate synthase n=1 Tax=Nocardioides marmotae TaxID=2663857 RepID=A0A6I3JCN4_9ACTN|nr:glucosyl-3-phosphoglycerate synthase [Nocardioides marmotae]MCR6032204.1 glucosyl-3-phosphoglycerate synthase [Gordonia jinghuaiqii]MTB95851.1 glucosyl-3-phosphoglycerate synthase [Nocardioides marmotae]QKE02798.1 glucosyl-3-phosphoglycerate synthase [Nocardioides marmotae]